MKSMKSILVIDEESRLLHTLTTILKRSGYVSYAAMSIEALISNLRSNIINLLVVNDRFFKHNEPDLLVAIKDANPGLPILLLSGWLSAHLATQLQTQTGCAVLNKPLDPADMLSAITEILG